MFATHLDLLAMGTERAARDGIFVAEVPDDRALVVSDFCGLQAQGWTESEFGERLERRAAAALRQARIGSGRQRNIHGTSLDSVSARSTAGAIRCLSAASGCLRTADWRHRGLHCGNLWVGPC